MKKIIAALLILLFPALSQAANALNESCIIAKGVLLTNNNISNYNIIIEPTLIAGHAGLLSLLYNGKWYESRDENATNFLSLIQFGITMNRKINICVSSTDGTSVEDRKLIGIEFSDTF